MTVCCLHFDQPTFDGAKRGNQLEKKIRAHSGLVILIVESGLIQLPRTSELDCQQFVASIDVTIRPDIPTPGAGIALLMSLVTADVAMSPHPSVSALLHRISQSCSLTTYSVILSHGSHQETCTLQNQLPLST